MRFAGSRIEDFMGDKPSFDRIGSRGTMNEAANNANVAMNNAKTADATMRGIAMVESAEAQADAIRAGGQASGQASMVSGIAGGIGGLGGLFRSGGGGSSYTPSSGWGSFGSVRFS